MAEPRTLVQRGRGVDEAVPLGEWMGEGLVDPSGHEHIGRGAAETGRGEGTTIELPHATAERERLGLTDELPDDLDAVPQLVLGADATDPGLTHVVDLALPEDHRHPTLG